MTVFRLRRGIGHATQLAPQSTPLRVRLFHVFTCISELLLGFALGLLHVTIHLLGRIVGGFADGFVDFAFQFSAVPATWSLFMVSLLV